MSEPTIWFIISIKAPWGTGYLSWDETPAWRQAITFGLQPIGVKKEHLDQILQAFPTANVQALPST